MKLTAKEVPYSSVVGGGIQLLDENGRPAFQVLLIGTTNGITKEQTLAMSRQIEGYINKHGLDAPGWPDPTPPRQLRRG